MPKLRYQPPDRIRGAADFSRHHKLRGSLNMVKRVKEQRWAWNSLSQACDLDANYARKRDPGHWELAAVAFVTSRHVDIQPWWDETTDELWRECGFAKKPSYPTVHRRLRELETICDVFLDAASVVIKRCHAHDPRVLAHAHVDCTEDETHAGLVHDCRPGDNCQRPKPKKRRARRRAQRLRRATTSVARAQRERWNAEDEAESEEHAREAGPEDTKPVQRHGGYTRRIRIGGCWYLTRDKDAGVRAYTRNGKVTRFWHGYYSAKLVDHLTGGVIPSVHSASTNECNLFPDLFDCAKGMLGKAPQTVTGDKGFSVASCFERATRNGTAPVFPWRKSGDGKRHDHEGYDRHGVKRCKHCGGPMAQTKFSAKHGNPRLWFQCQSLATEECAKPQTITCNKDWRLLVPLARTEPLYHELKESHQTYEAAHDYWRDRYRVAADALANRPKVIGIGWHRLRANVACFVDWLRIATINGWLGSARNALRRAGERPFKRSSRESAAEFCDNRQDEGLGDPYGPQAKKLGLGDEEPPSERGDPDST